MTEIEFEKYCFLRLHSIDMDTALHTLKLIKRYKRDDIRIALLRDLAVIYARPFSGNRGEKIPKHTLSEIHVPKSAKTIHKKLLELRNCQLAHADLSFHKPKVLRWRADGGNTYPMSFKAFDYQGLLRQLSPIEALITSVEANISSEVKSYESHI